MLKIKKSLTRDWLNFWSHIESEFRIHVSVRILTLKISQCARVNFCSYRKNQIRDCFFSFVYIVILTKSFSFVLFCSCFKAH